MRGFPDTEYQARTQRAQALMDTAGLDAILLTTEPEMRYFTGYLTRFWESPCRPWFLVVPATGKPIAVIPTIGAELMGTTWVDDIRTWRAPDLDDDGVTLLAECLRQQGANIGMPMGAQSSLRMPMRDWMRLNAALHQPIRDDADIIRKLRLIKSDGEIEKIRHSCAIAGRAFARVPEIARTGTPLDQVFRDFQRLCLEEGGDWVPYLSGGADQNGYGDIIALATPKPLVAGDVLMLDTGIICDGYFCDFDRNFAVGGASDLVQSCWNKLIDATHAAFDVAKPGATAADMFHAMDQILTGGSGGSDAGRYGHGLGLNLTEWPSFIPTDHTVLETGMVLTIEPSIMTEHGKVLVHEENIVIRDTGAEYLSPPAGRDMTVLA